jgi:superfamily II DNA or RNA helicase
MSQLDMFGQAAVARSVFDWDTDDDDGLRYYQTECVERIEGELRNGPSTLAVLATGLGKTQVFSVVAKRWTGRVLVLAHRDELVQQARARLEQVTGEAIGVEQAEWYSGKERIVVGSVQTVYKDKRLERMLMRGNFSLVIVDEGHHYTAVSYRRPLDRLRSEGAKVLGVTATPDRSDEEALGQIFESVAFRMEIAEGMEAGYLVPVVGQRVWVESVNLSEVKSTAGDLNLKDLDEVMLKGVEGIVKETVSRWPDRCGPVFLPGKASAKLAAERFNAIKPYSAAVVTDDTSKEDRRQIMADVKRGRIQYLCNCMVATEGFDWPQANIVVCGRPTKSRSLYAQMVGRGTRVLPGLVETLSGRELADARRAAIAASAKPDCLIADFCGNSGKHRLIGPEDVLGGTFTPLEVKLAKELAAKKEGGDPRENLKEARSKLAALALKKVESEVKAKSEAFDPFSVLSMKRDEHAAATETREAATDNQVGALTKWGVPEKDARKMSKREATKMLGNMVIRKDKGLASYKQLMRLRQFGYTGSPNITFDRGKAAMNYLEQLGWGRKGKVNMQALERILTHK